MGLGQKFKHMELLYFIRRFQGTFFNNNRNILVIKCEKHNPPKIVGKFLSGKTRSEYLKQTERLSRNVKPFSTFRNFQAIFASSNSYFTAKSRWVPLENQTSQNKKSPLIFLIRCCDITYYYPKRLAMKMRAIYSQNPSNTELISQS